MVKKTGIILLLVLAAQYAGRPQGAAPTGLPGLAFAQLQEDGQPCPPECITDSMEIVTWYPSPYNEYEELRLYPKYSADESQCNSSEQLGLIYYNKDEQALKVCWQDPGDFSYSWEKIALGQGGYWQANGNDIFNINSGNVGIGVGSRGYKLDVRNGRTNVSELCINEDCKTTWPVGVNGTEIPTASVSSSKGYIEVKIGNNFYALPYYNYVLNQALSMGSHTTHDCFNAGGTAVEENSVRLCKFSASSCPAGWVRYLGWSTTVAQSCAFAGGLCSQWCTTLSHNWSNNSTIETCTYTYQTRIRGGSCVGDVYSGSCSAMISEVGCY